MSRRGVFASIEDAITQQATVASSGRRPAGGVMPLIPRF
jgi:hypothetical protein